MPIEFPKRLFRHKKVATAVGGTYDDVEFAPIEHGEQIFVEWVSAVNEDNAVTQVRLILVSGETEYNIEAQGTTAANLLRGWQIHGWMNVGDYGIARFYGATAGDKLIVCSAGFYREYVEGVEF